MLEDDPHLYNSVDYKVLKEQAERELKRDEESSAEQLKQPSHEKELDLSYRNKAYWQLPENVRNAIDLAKIKSQHSDFFYKL